MKIPAVSSQYTLGISNDGLYLRAVLLKYERGAIIHGELFEEKVNGESSTKAFCNRLATVLKRSSQIVTVLGLPNREVGVKNIHLPFADKKAISSLIPFQLEGKLPYSIEETIYEYQVFQENSNQSVEIAVAFSKKESGVESSTEFIENGIPIELITAAPLTLPILVKFLKKEATHYFLAVIEEENVTCLLVQQGICVAIRSFKTVTFHPVAVASEILRSFEGYSRTFSYEEEGDFYLIGAKGDELESMFKDQFEGRKVSYLDPSILFGHKGTIEKYIFPLSYAFSSLSKRGEGEEELFIPNLQLHPWPSPPQRVRIVKKILPLLLLYICALVFLILFFYQLKQRELQKTQTYLDQVYQTFEDRSSIAPVVESPEDFLLLANEIKSAAKAQLYPFALQPTQMNVSQTVQWISDINESFHSPEQIKIQKLHYFISKMPSKTQPKDPYQIKVEIEFTSDSPRTAREFQEKIAQSKDKVDTKNTIEWLPLKDSYQISFFLKEQQLAEREVAL